jgi:hypothetical protein
MKYPTAAPAASTTATPQQTRIMMSVVELSDEEVDEEVEVTVGFWTVRAVTLGTDMEVPPLCTCTALAWFTATTSAAGVRA